MTAATELHHRSKLTLQPRGDLGAGSNRAASPKNISETERVVSTALGGGMLLLALGTDGWGRLALLGAGAALAYRGVSGHCHTYDLLGMSTAEHSCAVGVPAQQGVKVEKSVTIHRPAAELYNFWHDVENLPSVMSHLEDVTASGDGKSHWIAKGPLNQRVEWDAEIINDRANELIAWRSLPGSQVETAGSVHFAPLSHNRGTAVRVSVKYNPPAGKLGDAVAWMLGDGLAQKLVEDLYRFKRAMEAGEIPTTAGQPHGS